MSTTPDDNVARGYAIDALHQAVGLLLRRAKRFSVDRAHELDPSLPASGYNLLTVIYHNGPHRAQQLAEIFELDKGAVSRYVQQLIDLGLIDRVPDPTDKRATLLHISDDGKRRLEEIFAQRRDEVVSTLLADWSPERVRNLADELAAYNDALDVGRVDDTES